MMAARARRPRIRLAAAAVVAAVAVAAAGAIPVVAAGAPPSEPGGGVARAAVRPVAGRAQARPLGGNINAQTNYSADFAFVDAYLTARAPSRLTSFGEIDLARDAPRDADGWPTTDFATYINEVAPQSGTYTVTGVSAARPDVYLLRTPGSVGTVTWSATTRRFTVPVTIASQGTPGTDGQFIIAFSGTSGGVRNLRVIRPGYRVSGHPTFTNRFVSFLRAHDPTVLRMMDLTATNWSVVRDWSERTRPGRWAMGTLTREVSVNDARSLAVATESVTSERGMAWEYAIDLCNAVDADCWLNVPLLATDAYVARLARLVKARLEPGLDVWVEYSNELWNDGAFVQGAASRAAAIRNPGDLAYDGLTDLAPKDRAVVLGDRRVAARIARIGRVFKNEFASDAARVHAVLAYQYANPDRTRIQLEYLDHVGTVSKLIDAIAIAPYVDLGYDADWNSLDVPGLSAAEILGLLDDSITAFETDSMMPDWVTLSTRYDVDLVAYEGGPDTFGGNNVGAKTAATLDSRMRGLMQRYLRAWFAQGGGQFNWYTLGADPYGHAFGTWSISNSITRTDSPKSLAFITVRTGG